MAREDGRRQQGLERLVNVYAVGRRASRRNEKQPLQSERVIDADGSTYTGRMEPLALTDARALANQKLDYAAQAKPNSPARQEKKESANEYYIHASGYNAQLKKPLSFEGNYIANSPSANEMRDKDEKNSGQARIVGTAKVEGEPPVEINAAAVPQ